MNLAELVRAAANGGARLTTDTTASGRVVTAVLSLGAAARLYGEVARDYDDGHADHPAEDPGAFTVQLEDADDDTATLQAGALRYQVELGSGIGLEPVLRLCEARGCPFPPLTRDDRGGTCGTHLTLLGPQAEALLGERPGTLEGAGREHAAARICDLRLNIFEENLKGLEESVRCSRDRLEELRAST